MELPETHRLTYSMRRACGNIKSLHRAKKIEEGVFNEDKEGYLRKRKGQTSTTSAGTPPRVTGFIFSSTYYVARISSKVE